MKNSHLACEISLQIQPIVSKKPKQLKSKKSLTGKGKHNEETYQIKFNSIGKLKS